MALSEQRHADILAGIERIREDKPFAERDDAIAALDWISAAAVDLNGAIKKMDPGADLIDITRLQTRVNELDDLGNSIRLRMTANDQKIPARHGGASSDELVL